jgi:undecaprenyl-diphosphatase
MGFRKEKIDDTVWTDLKLILIVLITSIITVVLAVAIDHYDDVFEASPRYVGILFVITGSILIISKFFAGEKGYKEIGLQSGIIAGIAQGLGVLPGISRSGITISAALFLGIKREKAGEFSFLIAIPAILGAFLFKLNDTQKMVIQPFDLIAGLVVCFFVGLGSLVLLIKLVEQRKFYLFSIYLIPAGIATLIFL